MIFSIFSQICKIKKLLNFLSNILKYASGRVNVICEGYNQLLIKKVGYNQHRGTFTS